MQDTTRLGGVIAPVATPFGEDGGPDPDRLIEHCEWLLEEGCHALAPFGTTSEAPSLGLDERMELLDDLFDAGVDPARLLPGTGSPSLADAIVLTEHAVEAGCAGVLVLPPYFYPNPSEEGLYRFYSELIEEVGDHRLRLYLYHIPQMTGVAITESLISRLSAAFPREIAGLKDSSGDMSNTLAMLRAFPELAIFPASESFMLEGLKNGAAGCISATANVQAREIRALFDAAGEAAAEEWQSRVARVRGVIQQAPMIPAVKAIIGQARGDAQWSVVRPPLQALGASEVQILMQKLRDEAAYALSISETA